MNGFAVFLFGDLIFPLITSIVEIAISEGDQAMRSSELIRLLEDLRKDAAFLQESRGMLRDPEAALRWAVDRGYRLTVGDIAELCESDRELSDDDLDQAAGGAWPPP